jgi:hypothetical protein
MRRAVLLVYCFLVLLFYWGAICEGIMLRSIAVLFRKSLAHSCWMSTFRILQHLMFAFIFGHPPSWLRRRSGSSFVCDERFSSRKIIGLPDGGTFVIVFHVTGVECSVKADLDLFHFLNEWCRWIFFI